MNNPFRSFDDYELFLYSLAENFPAIRGSTIVFVRRGAALARVAGELLFEGEVRLVVRERILHAGLLVKIDGYGYEVWQENQKLYWYDSQEHPTEPSLQSTHPHHKHIPPDMKHHRIPAPEIRFTNPNIPVLIKEIEETLLRK